jgi:hypothetical protein
MTTRNRATKRGEMDVSKPSIRSATRRRSTKRGRTGQSASERNGPAVARPEDTPEPLQVRVQKIDGREIVGWAWDPRAPQKRIRLEVAEGLNRLAVVAADEYRPELARLGCGDGHHGFRVVLRQDLLSEGSHILTIRCVETGVLVADLPIRVEHEPFPGGSQPVTGDDHQNGDLPPGQGLSNLGELGGAGQHAARGKEQNRNDFVAHPVWLVTPGDGLETARGTLSKLRAVQRTVSRSDVLRLQRLNHFGVAKASQETILLSDWIRSARTHAAKFITDSMVAIFQLREDVQQRFQPLYDEAAQYALLVWYLCARPVEEGLRDSSEPTGPILSAMWDTRVSDETKFGFPCNALMLAAYCHAYSGGSMPPPHECWAEDIIAWFFREGAYDLRMSHVIPQAIRGILAGVVGVSPISEWAAERARALGSSETDYSVSSLLETQERGPGGGILRDMLRETLIANGQSGFDDPIHPAIPRACNRLRAVVPDVSEYLVIDGQPVYFCENGNGERLLLSGEWYAPELRFVWSRAPISTILFSIASGPIEWLRIALLFDRSRMPERELRILLNHNPIWAGTVGFASADELILACTRNCLALDAVNLLQIEVSSAFVPAEYELSSDQRRLGIGVKRLWIQRAEIAC